jgi:hypothetical protein
MHGHNPVATAGGQRRPVGGRQFRRAGAGRTDLRALVQIGRHGVDAVAQIGPVDQNM